MYKVRIMAAPVLVQGHLIAPRQEMIELLSTEEGVVRFIKLNHAERIFEITNEDSKTSVMHEFVDEKGNLLEKYKQVKM